MNEMSGRYSEMPEEFYIPGPDVIRIQSKTNKQGRGELAEEDAVTLFRDDCGSNRGVFAQYQMHLHEDIARELARINLPLSTYTEKVWQMNLHNLLHFLKLRTDAHAQWEIRQYANVIEEIVAECFPMTYGSWKNHVKDAVTFSADEQAIIRRVFAGADWATDPEFLGQVSEYEELSKRRKDEFRTKLRGLV